MLIQQHHMTTHPGSLGTRLVPTWCGWGVLWLVIAQPTIRFRRFGRGAAFLGAESILLSFCLPCRRTGRPAGPGAALSWYFCLPAHGSGRSAHAVDGMVLCRLLVETVAVSLVGPSLSRCELCQLVVIVVVVDIVVLVCSSQISGNGVSMERPYRFGVDIPSFCRSPLRDLASSYTPLGGGNGPTLPHREARVSGVGSPWLKPRSSLGTPARCVWLGVRKE